MSSPDTAPWSPEQERLNAYVPAQTVYQGTPSQERMGDQWKTSSAYITVRSPTPFEVTDGSTAGVSRLASGDHFHTPDDQPETQGQGSVRAITL